MATNGGFVRYSDKVTKDIFFRASETDTINVTVVAGQVLKKRSFVEFITSGNDIGKVKAHAPLVEGALLTFSTGLTAAAQTITIAGLILTATAAMSVAEIIAAFDGVVPGVTPTNPAKGTFSGTLAGFAISAYDADTLEVAATTAASNVTDVTYTSATATVVLNIVQGSSFRAPDGILLYDVDASTGAKNAEIYIEASFWADALVWAVDPTVDVVTKPDGTTVACTAYNTGCAGNSATANNLKKMFVSTTEFAPLGFRNPGDYV